MEMSVTQSWWADPTVQRDYAAFSAAVKAQEPRWLEQAKDIERKMAGLATPDWMIGVRRSRTVGFSVAVI